MHLALLVQPALNRVYAQEAPRLLAAELTVLAPALLQRPVGDVEVAPIAGLPYVCFTVDGEPGAHDLAVLGSLSSAYALFERVGDALRPVELPVVACFDDDLVTVPKYPGKTNEHLTRLLLNVTVAGCSPQRRRAARLHVLDPLAGRGTTLSVALLAGMDVTGIEISESDVDAYRAFLVGWLRGKRLKHSAEVTRLRRDGRTYGSRLDVTVAPSREADRAGERQRLSLLRADTVEAADLLARESVDLIVTDLPYGVKQGSRAGGARSRHPADLLEAALPGWVRLLRPGGALGLSWNTHVLPPERLAELLAAQDLAPVELGTGRLAHRVDQAIHRDLAVVRKP